MTVLPPRCSTCFKVDLQPAMHRQRGRHLRVSRSNAFSTSLCTSSLPPRMSSPPPPQLHRLAQGTLMPQRLPRTAPPSLASPRRMPTTRQPSPQRCSSRTSRLARRPTRCARSATRRRPPSAASCAPCDSSWAHGRMARPCPKALRLLSLGTGRPRAACSSRRRAPCLTGTPSSCSCPRRKASHLESLSPRCALSLPSPRLCCPFWRSHSTPATWSCAVS